MNIRSSIFNKSSARSAFTLIELMTSTAVGLVITGSVVMLLYYSAREQAHGIGALSVEEQAYLLQNNITSTLRALNANQGITPDATTSLLDSGGNIIGYTTIRGFSITSSGAQVTSKIAFYSSSNAVVYTPDISAPNTVVNWATTNSRCIVRNLYFCPSLNIVGQPSAALVNVYLSMDDNGWSNQATNANASLIYRTFSVFMKVNN